MGAHRRFDLRLTASRRLRAALFLVFLLGLFALSQTGFSSLILWMLLFVLSGVFLQAWQQTRITSSLLLTFDDKQLGCWATDATGKEQQLKCTSASVYPWLIVLRFEALKRPLVLLPDSLSVESRGYWRRLLVWSLLIRRQIGSA